MFKLGHYGVALLVFAPIGFHLVSQGHPAYAFVTGAVMLWLAMLPDVDHRIPGVRHRGPTHSLLFAALVGAAFAGVGYVLGDALAAFDRATLVGFGFFVGAVSILAHLLGDALTPMGVNFLWPLSRRRYSLSLTPADSTLWNYGLFALGLVAVAAAASLSLGVV